LSIRLEPLGAEHVADVEAMLGDPDLLRFTRIPEPVPPGFASAWLERYEEGRRDGSREAFAIVGGEGEFLGIAMAPRIDRESQTAELGYVVAPVARGRGVATEALRRLTAWAFEELGMLRLELMISVENPASKKVAERCGYVFEGVLRSLYFKPGLREDTEIWSRLATDP
jgi:RimJ/RimL family protein N-acetyltransferase